MSGNACCADCALRQAISGYEPETKGDSTSVEFGATAIEHDWARRSQAAWQHGGHPAFGQTMAHLAHAAHVARARVAPAIQRAANFGGPFLPAPYASAQSNPWQPTPMYSAPYSSQQYMGACLDANLPAPLRAALISALTATGQPPMVYAIMSYLAGKSGYPMAARCLLAKSQQG